MKNCSTCGLEKPLSEFYRQANDTPVSKCRSCYNAACQARKLTDPGYRFRQYKAKRRWVLQNRNRDRMHGRRCHGRLIWDQQPVPAPFQETEAALWSLCDALLS